MSRERRLSPRFRIDTTIQVNGDTALAINLSRGGVFFESSKAFVAGEHVELVFPEGHAVPGAAVTFSAQVVRVEPRGAFFGVAARYEPLAFTMPA